jgi:hypothetical protein
MGPKKNCRRLLKCWSAHAYARRNYMIYMVYSNYTMSIVPVHVSTGGKVKKFSRPTIKPIRNFADRTDCFVLQQRREINRTRDVLYNCAQCFLKTKETAKRVHHLSLLFHNTFLYRLRITSVRVIVLGGTVRNTHILSSCFLFPVFAILLSVYDTY